MSTGQEALRAVADARCISLTTFKRDGTPIATPVWCVELNDRLYTTTSGSSGKVKRIRNNGNVEFATCRNNGTVTGPTFNGTARIISEHELAPVAKAKKRRYFSYRFISLFSRDQTGIEITPGDSTQPAAHQ